MEIVLNRCWGGFSLSEKACEVLGLDSPYDDVDRTDPRLIEMVRTWKAEEVNGHSSKLAVVVLPFDTTDWTINDYDGMETVYYVVNGKIYTA